MNNIVNIPQLTAPTEYPTDILIDLVCSTKIDLNFYADAEKKGLVDMYSDAYGTGANWLRPALKTLSRDMLWTLYLKFKQA